MTTFEFSIIASGLDPQADDFESRFYEAGCDDATISFQRGRIIVDFARSADTIEDAIASAVSAVRAVGASVERVEPDPLVSLSDIASRSKMTRAAISQYANGQRGKDFPAPIARVTSDSPLYDWAAVAAWLVKNDRLARDALSIAEAVEAANVALRIEQSDFASYLMRRVKKSEASPSS